MPCYRFGLHFCPQWHFHRQTHTYTHKHTHTEIHKTLICCACERKYMQIYAFSVLLGESEGIHFSGFKTEPIMCQEKVKAQIRSIRPNIKPKQIGPAYHTLHMIVRVLHYQHWKYILVKLIIVPLKM